MTLLIEDPYIEEVIEMYLLVCDRKHKYAEALCAVAGKHDTFECGKWHVLCCDSGEVVVRRRDSELV